MSSCGGKNVIGCTEDANDGSYMFAKSLKELHNKDSLAAELRLLKLQMVGTEKPSSTFGDPMLHFVLGFAKMPSNEAITDYYRPNNGSCDDAAFSQMCMFLNKEENSKEVMDLDIVAADKWMHYIKVADKFSLLEAERIGYRLRYISGQKVGVLCEMAARGNLWDAFILMSLLYPDHEYTNYIRSHVWKQFDLGWIDKLISEKSEPVNFENLAKSGLNAMDCYLTVMNSLSDNKENSFVRSCLYGSMRVYLLTAVCESEVEGRSRDLMDDYFNFISSEAVFLQECLPGLQKSYFKQASVVIRDFIRVVLHVCNVVKSDEVANYEEGSSGVLSNLVASWVTNHIIPEDGLLAEITKGVNEVLRSFVGDFLDSPYNISKGSSYKVYILVALLIAEVMFRNTLAHSNGILIFDLLSKCDSKDQLINGLLKTNISPKTPTSRLEGMVSSVRDCLLGIRKMLCQQSQFNIQSAGDQSERLGVNTDMESMDRKENTVRTSNDDLTLIKKTCDSVLSSSVDLDSGSSLYRSPSTEKDLLQLRKLQNNMVQDPSFSRDNIVLSPAPQLQPESIVSQDNILLTKLTTKWEQPDTTATQSTATITESVQMRNGDSHVQHSSVVVEKEVTENSMSPSQNNVNTKTETDSREKILQPIVNNALHSVGGGNAVVSNSPVKQPAIFRQYVELTEQNAFFNNTDVVDVLDRPCMPATLSTSYVVHPSTTDVSASSTRNAEMTANNSVSSAEQANPSTSPQEVQQVSMFSSHFKQQQQSGWGSDGDDGGVNKSTVGFVSQAGGDNGGSSRFGNASRGGGGFGNIGERGGGRDRSGYSGNGRGGYGDEGGRGNGYSGRRGERGGNVARGRGERGNYGGRGRGDRGNYSGRGRGDRTGGY